MRSRAGVALLLSCVALTLSPVAPSAFAAPPEDASSNPYIALGDSITAGVGASSSGCAGTHETPPCNGFAGLLFSRYKNSLGVTHMVNRGSLGATSSGLLGQSSQAVTLIEAPSDTRAVTVGFGGNELLSGTCDNTWGEAGCPVRGNLTTGLEAIRAALDAEDAAAETFAVMAYYNPGIGGTQEQHFRRQLLGTNGVIGLSDTGANVGLNDVIHQVAADPDVGATAADPYAKFAACGQGFISAGDQYHHPNTPGHAALASTFPGGPATPACPASNGDDGQTPAGIATLETGSVKVKKNKFEIEIACNAGGAACAGVAEVETAKPVSLSAAVAAKRKIVELGSTSFSIPAGATQPVSMKLSKKGKKLFRSKRQVKANVTVTTRGSTDIETTTSALTIKRKK